MKLVAVFPLALIVSCLHEMNKGLYYREAMSASPAVRSHAPASTQRISERFITWRGVGIAQSVQGRAAGWTLWIPFTVWGK
jgi:hypothetical protein